MSQFELRPCTVCGLLDGDYRPKKVSYCSVCDVWLCQKDVGDVVRRAVAAYKRHTGRLKKSWDKLKNLTFMGYGDEWSVVDDAGGGVQFVEQVIASGGPSVTLVSSVAWTGSECNGAFINSVTCHTTQAIPIGSRLLVVGLSNTSWVTLNPSVSDPGSNSWSVAVQNQLDTSAGTLVICDSVITTGIASNGLITLSIPGSGGSAGADMVMFALNSYSGSSGADTSGSYGAFGGTATATTGSSLSAQDFVIAGGIINNNGAGYTFGAFTAGYTMLESNLALVHYVSFNFSFGWKSQGAGAAASASSVLSTGNDAILTVAGYKQ